MCSVCSKPDLSRSILCKKNIVKPKFLSLVRWWQYAQKLLQTSLRYYDSENFTQWHMAHTRMDNLNLVERERNFWKNLDVDLSIFISPPSPPDEYNKNFLTDLRISFNRRREKLQLYWRENKIYQTVCAFIRRLFIRKSSECASGSTQNLQSVNQNHSEKTITSFSMNFGITGNILKRQIIFPSSNKRDEYASFINYSRKTSNDD